MSSSDRKKLKQEKRANALRDNLRRRKEKAKAAKKTEKKD